MSKFSKGDTVRCTHGAPEDGLFAGRNYEAKAVYVATHGDAYVDVGVHPDGWNASRFEKVEPEDTDDAEPEPLAEWEQALLDEADAENAVTINMLDLGDIDRFARALPEHWSLVNEDGTIDAEVINDMQAALRAFANPTPVVSEPTGLGAVIVATFASDRPVTWVRISRGGGAPWRAASDYDSTTEVLWSQLDNITVLSEGVTEGGAS